MAGFWSFIKAIPALISLFREVWAVTKEALDYWEKIKRAKELKEAIKHAKETNDTSKLEKFFSGDARNDLTPGASRMPGNSQVERKDLDR